MRLLNSVTQHAATGLRCLSLIYELQLGEIRAPLVAAASPGRRVVGVGAGAAVARRVGAGAVDAATSCSSPLPSRTGRRPSGGSERALG